MQRKVLVEIVKTENGYGAHAPHYPGCVAAGKTFEETRIKMREALEWHIGAMIDDEEELQPDSEYCEIMAVEVPESVKA